jgi:hypothetical protein
MKYTRTSPVGIDKPIQRIQNSLYDFAQSKWSLSESQILAFGRVEKIGDKLRWYKQSSTKDYEEFDMLLSDLHPFEFFFVTSSSLFTSIYESEVGLYVFANLSVLKPLVTHRADEEVRKDIADRFRIAEWFSGFSDATDLPGYMDVMNMQPYHAFKINLNLHYS